MADTYFAACISSLYDMIFIISYDILKLILKKLYEHL